MLAEGHPRGPHSLPGGVVLGGAEPKRGEQPRWGARPQRGHGHTQGRPWSREDSSGGGGGLAHRLPGVSPGPRAPHPHRGHRAGPITGEVATAAAGRARSRAGGRGQGKAKDVGCSTENTGFPQESQARVLGLEGSRLGSGQTAPGPPPAAPCPTWKAWRASDSSSRAGCHRSSSSRTSALRAHSCGRDVPSRPLPVSALSRRTCSARATPPLRAGPCRRPRPLLLRGTCGCHQLRQSPAGLPSSLPPALRGCPWTDSAPAGAGQVARPRGTSAALGACHTWSRPAHPGQAGPVPPSPRALTGATWTPTRMGTL